MECHPPLPPAAARPARGRSTGLPFSLLFALALIQLHWGARQGWAQEAEPTASVTPAGTITAPGLSEASGLVASRRYPGIFWTHNDGDRDELFAITRAGEPVGRFELRNAKITDWEDIEVDNAGNLYVADIGDNDGSRKSIRVYQIREPNPQGSGKVPVRRSWTLMYPGGQTLDAESFFVSGRFGYILAKDLKNGAAPLYRFPLVSRSSRTLGLQPVTSVPLDSVPTSADLSANGRALAVVTDQGVYLFSARGNILNSRRSTRTFTPYELPGMEGGTFVGDGFLVSSESGDLVLFTDPGYRRR